FPHSSPTRRSSDLRYVGVKVETFITFFPHFLAQLQLSIGFTVVTKTVITLTTGRLETLLFTATSRPADTGTSITMEIHSQCLSRHYARCDGNCQRKFAQSNHYSIS